jgi:hypothetical protein
MADIVDAVDIVFGRTPGGYWPYCKQKFTETEAPM